jgi:hypothetical protein
MPDPSRSAPRNILRDDDTAAPPAITHTTEAVVALLARACRATCGELGDDGKLEAARLMFTTAVLALRELDPRADAIVRHLAHDRLRVVARAIARHKGDGTAGGPNPDMIPLSRAIMPRY